MILRRKVFSQDSYSILDAIEEKAFCEGYECAQREFARADYMGLDNESATQLKSMRNERARYLLNERASHSAEMKNNINRYLKGFISEKELARKGEIAQEGLDRIVKSTNKAAARDREAALARTQKNREAFMKRANTQSKLLGEIGTNVRKDPNKFSGVAKLAKRWIH